MSRISIREINEIIDEALPIAQLFAFRTEALTPGGAVVRLPFKRALTRPGGT
ncbi:MAG: PaaI family thioesterase, partial [Proteobacteria bacterium]|nr:PaaI family thioesterase [Pseudomonadota bacterium]